MVVYEEGYGLICRVMLDLPEGQCRAPVPSRQVAAFRDSTVAVEADFLASFVFHVFVSQGMSKVFNRLCIKLFVVSKDLS